MKKQPFLVVLLAFLAVSAFAQTVKKKDAKPKKPTFERKALKLGMIAVGQPNGFFSFENRVSETTGFEFGAAFFKYKKPSELKIFDGAWVTEYSRARSETRNIQLNQLLGSTDWTFLAGGGLLPQTEPRVASSALQLRAGYRYFFPEKLRSKWRTSLSPSLTATRFEFFDSVDYFETLATRIFSAEKDGIRTTRTTEDIRQTRRINQKIAWQPGISLELAVTRRLRFPFFFEARLMGGVNIDEPLLEAAPVPVGQTWRAAAVQFGMFLGDDPLSKKKSKKKKRRLFQL